MTHPERVADYLGHIIDAIDRATRYAGTVGNLAGLEQDQMVQDAIVRTLSVIGEAVTRLQKEAPEFVTGHPEVPWESDAWHAQQDHPRVLRRGLGCRLEHRTG